MSERRDEHVGASTGEIVTVTNEGLTPQAVTVDCGNYGTIMFNLPINGEVRLRVGSKPPKFLFNDIETDILDGENVVRIPKLD